MSKLNRNDHLYDHYWKREYDHRNPPLKDKDDDEGD